MKPLVIYHSPCQDGFVAAWAVWKKHPDWDFYPAKYDGKIPEPDVTGREVFLVDFSYKRPKLLEMAAKAEGITVLDHHKTAQADLIDLPENIAVFFNMEKSGARLAWEYFHSDKDIPEIVLYVEDRDLWRFQYQETKAISQYLFSHPYDFYTVEGISAALENSEVKKQIISEGDGILRQHNKDVEELIQNRFRMAINGQDVWVANLPYTLCSDAANQMSKGEPFAATYYYDGEGYIFSLRSQEDGLDVSEIAKKYGGGGHKHAAGFKIKQPLNLSI